MRKRIWLLAFVAVLGLLVIARDALVTKAAEVYVLKKMTSQGWTFENVQREKNTLHIKKLSYQNPSSSTFVEEAHVAFHLSLIPLQIHPTVNISKLLIDITNASSSDDSMLGLLLALGDRRLDLKLSIGEGEVRGVLENPFGFSFTPGAEKREIGTLQIQDLEKKAFLSTHLRWEKDSLVSQLEIEKGSASDLITLASFMQVDALKGWSQGEGEVSASIKTKFHPKKGLEEMEGKLDLEDISFFHPEIGGHVLSKSLKGTLLFSPKGPKDKNLSFWKRVDLFLTFEDTSFGLQQKDFAFGVSDVLGEMRLTPDDDPYLKMGGKVLSNKQEIPFEVEGKGQLLEKRAFWLETKVDFFLPKKEPHLFISYAQNETGESSLQIECKEIAQEVFNILTLSFPYFHLPECSMLAGEFAGNFTGSFKQGLAKTLTLSEFKSKGLALTSANYVLKNSSEIAFSGSLEQGKLVSLEADVSKVDFDAQNKELVRSLSGKLSIASGAIVTSSLEGFYQGIWGSAQVLDSSAPDLVHIECKAPSSDLMQKIWKGSSTKDQASVTRFTADVSNLDGKAHGACLIKLISSSGVEEEIDLQLSLNKEISRKVSDLLTGFDFSSLRGFFKTDRLSSDTSSLWIKPFLGALTLEGYLSGEGEFDRKKLSVDVFGASFNLSDGSWDVSAKLGSDAQKAHITYDYKEGLWKGTIPVDLLHVQNSKLHLEAKVQNSLLFFEGDQLWTDHLEADAFGSKLLGTLLINKSGVHLASKSFEGDLLTLTPVVARYYPQVSSLGLKGTFSVDDHSCVLEGKKQGDLWVWDWKASIGLKDLACNFGKVGKIHQGRVRLEANSLGDFKCRDIQGYYALGKSGCPFALSDIGWSSSSGAGIDFSLLAKDPKREWAYVQGKVEKQKGGVVVSLSPHCHLLGLVMDIAPFMITEKYAVSPLKVSSSIKLEQLPSYFTMWKEMGISIPQMSFLEGYLGTVGLQAVYDLQKSAWKASLKSSEIATSQNVIGKASCLLTGDAKQIKIESCEIGSASIAGSLDFQGSEWVIPSLSVEWDEGRCQIKGKYYPLSSKLIIPTFSASFASKELGTTQVQGVFEGTYLGESSSFQGKGSSRVLASLPASIGIGVESTKDIPFVFDSKRGMQIEKSQWELTSLKGNKQRLGKFATKTLTYVTAEKRVTLQGGALTLSKDSYKLLQTTSAFADILKDIQIDQEIDLQGEVDIAPKHRKMTATLNNGKYKIKGMPFELKQTKLQLDQDDFYMSCQTKCQDEPLLLNLQMKLGALPTACLLIKDHPEQKGMAIGLKKSLKDGWFCDGIQGSCKGISLQVQKTGSSYDVQMTADLTQVPALLPKPWAASMKKWSLGPGYSFKGSLALNPKQPFQIQSLKGDLLGNNFEFLGKTFSSLSAKVDFSANKGRIHSVKLEDDLANLSIKTIDLAFNPEIKSWDISAPLIYVKDFAPALFIKGRKERGVEIKNLGIYDLKGVLSKVESFEAKGALFFSSFEKKEFSFWDAPLNLMKDWGLDPGILTPVTGEADFVLRHGCFYFTALRNVYSDGQRSQFYLAEGSDASYLALDGSWHVDLSMKQNVVWKVTEDLVLSIRGTVDKPKYSFKSSKKSR